MNYRLVYDVRDEAGWFLLDSALLAALAGLVSFVMAVIAFHGLRVRTTESPHRQNERVFVYFGVAGCVIFGGLLAAWLVRYSNGGPVDDPTGQIAWLVLSGGVLVAGLHRLRHPSQTPTLELNTRLRVGLLLGAVALACVTIVLSWGGYAELQKRKETLEAGNVEVLEGTIIDVRPTKQGTRVTVGRTVFSVGDAHFGHLGRQVHLQPGLSIRVSLHCGRVLRLEAAD
jgi:hypothetical protein